MEDWRESTDRTMNGVVTIVKYGVVPHALLLYPLIIRRLYFGQWPMYTMAAVYYSH
jgi:hypothetical protein